MGKRGVAVTFVETRVHEYKDESCYVEQDRKAY